MASVLHDSARTTPRLRAELQASQESSRALAARYGLNAKTVRKWRKRTTTVDAPMGPKSRVLTPAEEANVVAFRQKTMLPLDDVLGWLKDTIPNLSRSALHRCLQRHGISRRPVEETGEKRKRFKTYEIGHVHIDSCELRHASGKPIMFLAIDRVSKFTYVEFHSKAGKMAGSAFLRAVVEVFRNRNVSLAVFIMIFAGGALNVVIAMTPSYLVDFLKLSPQSMGFILSATGVGALVGGMLLPALSDRMGRRPVMLGSSVAASRVALAMFECLKPIVGAINGAATACPTGCSGCAEMLA